METLELGADTERQVERRGTGLPARLSPGGKQENDYQAFFLVPHSHMWAVFLNSVA